MNCEVSVDVVGLSPLLRVLLLCGLVLSVGLDVGVGVDFEVVLCSNCNLLSVSWANNNNARCARAVAAATDVWVCSTLYFGEGRCGHNNVFVEDFVGACCCR